VPRCTVLLLPPVIAFMCADHLTRQLSVADAAAAFGGPPTAPTPKFQVPSFRPPAAPAPVVAAVTEAASSAVKRFMPPSAAAPAAAPAAADPPAGAFTVYLVFASTTLLLSLAYCALQLRIRHSVRSRNSHLRWRPEPRLVPVPHLHSVRRRMHSAQMLVPAPVRARCPGSASSVTTIGN